MTDRLQRSKWVRSTPTEQARYWYWDGHEDSAPINVGVFWSPSGCFVHVGQLGITQAIDCKEWDGWWLLDETPLRPGDTAAPAQAKQKAMRIPKRMTERDSIQKLLGRFGVYGMVPADVATDIYNAALDDVKELNLASNGQAWVDQVMDQAQVFASAWSLVGGQFDTGNGLEHAEEEKQRLREMLEAGR